MQSLPNDCAEASLSPLWRTLDRLHHQSASQNLAFRSALTRLAKSMKKLYRAYIAAHALAIVNRSRSPLSPASSMFDGDQDEASVYLQSRRIITHRIITASAGYSKQFLGLQRSSSQHASVAHNEAVEDAFLDAAHVFSPTELPSNRCAWLRKLAEFHHDRRKFAEEATCRSLCCSSKRHQRHFSFGTAWSSLLSGLLSDMIYCSPADSMQRRNTDKYKLKT